MLKLLLTLLLLTFSSIPSEATVQWRNGTGADTILGTSNASDIDTNTRDNIVKPLDDLLANYKQGMMVTYSSASQLSVTAGSIMVSNADGSIRLMLRNSAATTVTWSDIDTGAEASGTTYYVYAIAASASATTATFKISASSTSPSGVTYYKRIGSFTNDSSSNITALDNDGVNAELGSITSKSDNVNYQALTDGIVIATLTDAGVSSASSYLTGYTDGASSPTTVRAYCSVMYPGSGQADHTGAYCSITMPVKAGDYYKVTQTASSNTGSGNLGTATVYFMAIN